jgi:rubrerythrin
MVDRSASVDIVATLAPILEAVPAPDHPLLIALLEGWAADRYRRWAEAATEPAIDEALAACAAREDEIATRVQELRDDAAEVQAALVATYPTLRADTDGGFAALPLGEQYALQAGGERLGAATWRALARAADERGDAAAAEVFTACAPLEEASAEVLEKLLA